jgi:hypothetical protein
MFVRDERASPTDDDAGDSIEHQPHWTTRRERIRGGTRLRGYLLRKFRMVAVVAWLTWSRARRSSTGRSRARHSRGHRR